MVGRILKLLCVFFSVLAVLLCGCDKHGKPGAEPAADFSADFSAEYQGLELAGRLTNTRQGVCSVSLSAPETLDGVCFRFRENALEICRDGVKAEAGEAYIPAASFPRLLRDAFRQTAEGKTTPAKEADALALTLDGCDGTLTLDGDGLPLRLSVPGARCSVEFKNCEKIGTP